MSHNFYCPPSCLNKEDWTDRTWRKFGKRNANKNLVEKLVARDHLQDIARGRRIITEWILR